MTLEQIKREVFQFEGFRFIDVIEKIEGEEDEKYFVVIDRAQVMHTLNINEFYELTILYLLNNHQELRDQLKFLIRRSG